MGLMFGDAWWNAVKCLLTFKRLAKKYTEYTHARKQERATVANVNNERIWMEGEARSVNCSFNSSVGLKMFTIKSWKTYSALIKAQCWVLVTFRLISPFHTHTPNPEINPVRSGQKQCWFHSASILNFKFNVPSPSPLYGKVFFICKMGVLTPTSQSSCKDSSRHTEKRLGWHRV